MNTLQTANRHAGVHGGSQISAVGKGDVVTTILSHRAAAVKSAGRDVLNAQALAATEKAEATAAWHRERAARYLAWTDTPWAAAQFRGHIEAAEFQDAIAARHRQIAAALEGVTR